MLTTVSIVDDIVVNLYANKQIPNISEPLWKNLTFIYNSLFFY